jgi:Fe-S cluster biogenesis protein NfuA
MDRDAVTAAVEEVARILRADGADLRLLEANAKTARIRLGLVLDSVSCEECILPPGMLYETIEQALQRRVPSEFELLLDDPRTSGTGPTDP